ncbi:MAG: hypothetical protein WBA93_24180 [Microcoleaceae cyanobacterium]
MLSQPTFGDHSLSQSFYQALINRFHDSLSLSTQVLLGECSFGFAPNSLGVKTFFIIAPSISVAEQLFQDIDSLKNRVTSLMAGVGQLGICMNPPTEQVETNIDNNRELEKSRNCYSEPNKFMSQYMMCKIFPIDFSNKNLD